MLLSFTLLILGIFFLFTACVAMHVWRDTRREVPYLVWLISFLLAIIFLWNAGYYT